MTPVTRDYLIYGLGTIAGFAVYFGLHNIYNVEFSISILVGFVACHGAIILGRKIF